MRAAARVPGASRVLAAGVAGLVLALSACSGHTTSKAGRGPGPAPGRTTTTAAPGPTTSFVPPTVPPDTTVTSTVPTPTVHVGGTLTFTTRDPDSGTATIDVTLDAVENPTFMTLPSADLAPGTPSTPPAGQKDVALKVTIDNVGTVIVPSGAGCQEHSLCLFWTIDTYAQTDSAHRPLYAQYWMSSTCQGTVAFADVAIDPGHSLTGCIVFPDIPDPIPVTEAGLWFEDTDENTGYPGMLWAVP